ncbi:MAG: hypothetical protein PHR38_06310 [Bacteroidales bacterium]|nr:hypothetical protein [Bacteroidales bacterium]MDD4712323.1 hypothetical protein [Bacteroidales bacterium]
MSYVYSISLIVIGVLVLRMTYKDGKKKKVTFTTDYIMHLKGYIGAIAFIIAGIMLLVKTTFGKGWW